MLLPLLQSDLYQVILNTMSGKLASSAPVWQQDSSAVTVVMASAGYPGSYKKGVEITGNAGRKEGRCKTTRTKLLQAAEKLESASSFLRDFELSVLDFRREGDCLNVALY